MLEVNGLVSPEMLVEIAAEAVVSTDSQEHSANPDSLEPSYRSQSDDISDPCLQVLHALLARIPQNPSLLCF
jgi:hypothetical protein